MLTRKIEEGFCLARLTATENVHTGAVTVSYISTHTSHELNLSECKYLPLPRSVRQDVQEMLSKNIRMEKVLDGERIKGELQHITAAVLCDSRHKSRET